MGEKIKYWVATDSLNSGKHHGSVSFIYKFIFQGKCAVKFPKEIGKFIVMSMKQ